MDNQQVIDLFISRGLVDNYLAQDMLNSIEGNGKSIAETLADFDVISHQDDVWPVIASEIGAEMVDLNAFEPQEELLGQLPGGMARLHGAFPVNLGAEGLYLAIADPLNPQTVEDLHFALGKEIIVMVAPDYLIEQKISQYYRGSGGMEDVLSQMDSKRKGYETDDLESEANSAPIIRYVDLVMHQAINEKASDIHFEPFEKEFKIRYRVDGALFEMSPPPMSIARAIISRVKVMSNMNIAETRIPQDGRIVKTVGDKQVDMRVSSLPTQHGESVVLRILDRSNVNLDLEVLGLPEDMYNYVVDTIHKPNGIFIVTGPTGAGKTTTLYAALRKINTIDAKLLTAEDPVEYDIDGIIQIPVNENIGLDFARILRAFLRQDPDRILVGEIRDKETAQISIQASLTGHLVLSTLHTNDAAGAVTRLVDMGVEPFLVAASLEGVLAQRLVRTVCKNCKAPYEPSQSLINQLGLSPHELGDKEFYTGQGCEICGNGYKGRQGLFELLDVSDPISELIIKRSPSVVIKQKAIELGMQTLREDGLRNIYNGTTTIEEVLKYT